MDTSTGKRPRAEVREPLSRTRILEAALRLIDAEGLDALSMRRLGSELGVEAMSLYHYFPSKDALLDGVVDEVLGEVPLPDPTRTDWADALREGFADFRRVMLAHPAVFPLVASRPPSTSDAMRPIAIAFNLFQAAGFGPREAVSAWDGLLAYVFGHILLQISGGMAVAHGGKLIEVVQDQTGDEFAALRAAWSTAGDWDMEQAFLAGLDTVIEGLRQGLGVAERPAPHSTQSLRTT